MIYVPSLDRAARSYPEQRALCVGGKWLTFREVHHRVGRLAAALAEQGFHTDDRLALLLPNESEYIELLYAGSRLGVIVVPLSTRYSPLESDRVIDNAAPRGLVRHSTTSQTTNRG